MSELMLVLEEGDEAPCDELAAVVALVRVMSMVRSRAGLAIASQYYYPPCFELEATKVWGE